MMKTKAAETIAIQPSFLAAVLSDQDPSIHSQTNEPGSPPLMEIRYDPNNDGTRTDGTWLADSMAWNSINLVVGGGWEGGCRS